MAMERWVENLSATGAVADDNGLPPTSTRHARLRVTPAPDSRNSLVLWHQTVSPLKVLRNGLLIQLSYYMPSLAVKRWMYRRMGMRVGRHVSFAWRTTPDLFFPEQIQVGDNSIVGYNTTILAHEYLIHEWRIGPVVIGEGVMIGANCTILPGVIIGDGAVVGAMSLVNRDVPAGAAVGGAPIRRLG